ncbi:hypothetical protein OCU04_000582 [Sclerotinia nivalis]|uniref:Uncharacterized protein n=1 Tax=Sclerotinia nivalis TaxID=352851 RepID=A0A9X0AXE8_9HELO|nr:hypothetical protein OCU04_000582 [Sclerotinia nivalis]
MRALMLISSACGRHPVTIARSERQFKRDQHLIERKQYSGQAFAALKRAKFFDAVHPNFRAQMFNLLVICRQAYLEIVGGALLYKLKAFRFTQPTIMAQFCIRIEPLWNFIQSLVLDFDVFSGLRLSHVLGVIEDLENFQTLNKLRVKVKIRTGVLGDEDPLSPQNLSDSFVNCMGLWQWTMRIPKTETHRLKNFYIEISGVEALWPFYLRFGGDKSGWHIIRNNYALQFMEVDGIAFRLTKTYPSVHKMKGLSEYNPPKDELIWYDYEEPVFDVESAQAFLEMIQEEQDEQDEQDEQE